MSTRARTPSAKAAAAFRDPGRQEGKKKKEKKGKKEKKES
jgi:hypothetical protein